MGLIVLTLLAGCGLFQVPLNGPMAIRFSPNGFEVTVCRHIDADGFSMSERANNDAEWVKFWEVDQPVKIDAGDVLSLARADVIGTTGGFQPAMEPGAAVSIYILDESGEGAKTLAANFHVPEGGLPSRQWMHPDGSLSDDACTAAAD